MLTDLSHLGRLVVNEDGTSSMDWRIPCHGYACGCLCGCSPRKLAPVLRIPIKQPWQTDRRAA